MKTEKFFVLFISILFMTNNAYSQAQPTTPSIETQAGDVYNPDFRYGVVLTSPNGTCFRMRVIDDGSFISEVVTCPGVQNQDLMINTCGTILQGSSATFTWIDPGFEANTFYDFHLGSSPGQSDIYDHVGNNVFNSSSVTVNNLPTDGRPIYVKLIVTRDGTFNDSFDVDCSCTAANIVLNQNEELSYDIPQQAIAPGGVNNGIWEQMTNNSHIFFSGNSSLVSVVDGGSGDYCLQIDQPANTLVRTVEGAAIPSRKTYRISQTVQFSPNWEPGQTSKTGKFGFGLAGGQSSSGGLISGGNSETTGFSFRPAFDDYQFIVYAYYATRPGMPTNGVLYGQEIPLGVFITPGQSYKYEIEVTHNSTGNADGSFNVYIDDTLVYSQTNVLLMTGTPEIDRVLMSSFHGGGNLGFTPTVDVWTRYKNIRVSYP